MTTLKHHLHDSHKAFLAEKGRPALDKEIEKWRPVISGLMSRHNLDHLTALENLIHKAYEFPAGDRIARALCAVGFEMTEARISQAIDKIMATQSRPEDHANSLGDMDGMDADYQDNSYSPPAHH